METTEEAKINEDVGALKDDIRQLQDDLALTMRSLRYRARNLAADSRRRVQTMVPGQRRKPSVAVETVVPGARATTAESAAWPRRRYYQRMPGWVPASIRLLAATFAVGMVAGLLLMRRRRVIVAVTPPAGRPWLRGWRRRKVRQTEEYEPAEWEPTKTATRRKSRIEKRARR